MYNIVLTDGKIINIKADEVEWYEKSQMMKLINGKQVVARINMDNVVGWINADYNQAAEQGCNWIPVSEKFPKENEVVIASAKYGVYPETRYTKKYGWEWAYEAGSDYWKELEDVTAWMPLPQQYKAESEDMRYER